MSNVNYKKVFNGDNLLDCLINNPLQEISKLNPPVSFDKNNDPLSYWLDKQWDYSQDKINLKQSSCVLDFEKNYSQLNDNLFQEFKYFILLVFLNSYQNSRDINHIKAIVVKSYPIFIAIQDSGNKSILIMNDEIGFHSVMSFLKNKYTFRSLKGILSVLKSFSEIIKPYFNLHLNWNKQNGLNSFMINTNNIAVKYCKTESDYVEQTL